MDSDLLRALCAFAMFGLPLGVADCVARRVCKNTQTQGLMPVTAWVLET